jgi:sugar O-acyltransferase (sialic acid O-acetyltransferase NeuD family)
MTRVLILGAGGHAKVVADILQLQGVELVGFLDDNPSLSGTRVLDVPVLGGLNQIARYASVQVILGIGSNRTRQKLVDSLAIETGRWINAIHPTAVIARSVQLGHGVVIAAQAAINPETIIGSHVIINTSASIDHDCVIGSYCHIAPGVHLAGGCKIGQGALVGIGAQAIVGRSVGEWSTVGAGSTVIRDVPDAVTAKGTPARWA